MSQVSVVLTGDQRKIPSLHRHSSEIGEMRQISADHMGNEGDTECQSSTRGGVDGETSMFSVAASGK